MRLLHVNAGNLYGGIETMLATVSRHADPTGSAEHAFALCFEGRLSAELGSAGAPVHLLAPVRARRPWTVLRARRALGELLRRERFDATVFHGPWSHALLGPAARRDGVALVSWLHGPPSGRHWLERLAGRVPPDLVLANSRFTAASVGRVFRGAPVEVVYCPVEAPRLDDPLGVRAAVRASLGTAPADVVIVSASRLERWKGLHLLVEALVRLAGVPGWSCWIAGGAQRPREEAYLRELRSAAEAAGGRIRFLGERTDVPALLASADVHCQPNTGPEPFGIAFVEALYAGLPVVTTAMGGALEIVDSRCGVLVEADPDRLAGALRLLVTDGAARRRLGRLGPIRARELCDPPRALEGLSRALAAALPSRRGRAAGTLLPPRDAKAAPAAPARPPGPE